MMIAFELEWKEAGDALVATAIHVLQKPSSQWFQPEKEEVAKARRLRVQSKNKEALLEHIGKVTIEDAIVVGHERELALLGRELELTGRHCERTRRSTRRSRIRTRTMAGR